MQCTHEHTENDDRNGHCVCVSCGAILHANFSASMDWIPNVGDGRQRGNNTVDSDDEITYVGQQSLQRYQYGLYKNSAKIYEDAKHFIQQICDCLRLTDFIGTYAYKIFKFVRHEHGTCRGRRKIGMIIACISISCQIHNVGITDGELLNCKLVQQTAKTMNSQKRIVLESLHKHNMLITERPNAAECSFRICNVMGLPHTLSINVSKLSGKLQYVLFMQSKSLAMIIGCSILHVVSKHELNINITTLCNLLDVTRPTLIKWYSEFLNKCNSDARQLIKLIDDK